jgi:hypothetical protein
MPKLKLTYLQIKEQAARDIRNRTRARQGQLLEEQKQNTARDRGRLLLGEDILDTDSETELFEDVQPDTDKDNNLFRHDETSQTVTRKIKNDKVIK